METENVKPYKKILAWQRGYQLVLETYKTTEHFPKEERYGITSQLRRTVVSVVANIVEGRAKKSEKDFLRYLNIAKGSLWECEFFLELSRDLGYLNPEEFERLNELQAKTAFLLYKFTESIIKNHQNQHSPLKPALPTKQKTPELIFGVF